MEIDAKTMIKIEYKTLINSRIETCAQYPDKI